MTSKLCTIDERLMTRRCVACGYDGALLRGGEAERCARCGCDLRKRRARSYAEMEGLVGKMVAFDAPQPRRKRDERLVHRWLAFLLLSLLGIMAIGYLASSALIL